MKTLGEKIRALRTAKGWSQEDIAHELNLSLPAYSKIERNITDVSLSRIEQVAKLFKLSAVQLLSYGEKNSNKEEIESLKKQLEESQKELLILQRKLIELMEEKEKKKK